MKIDSVYELCEAVCDFHDMMMNDRIMIMKQNETLWEEPEALSKLGMLTNLVEDFSDLAEFAKRYCEQNDDTL